MKPLAKYLVAGSLFLIPILAFTQGLDPSSLLHPLADYWPTYSGDYSGRHYSALNQINQSNIRSLGLAWVSRITAGTGIPNDSLFGGPTVVTPTIVGGETTQDIKVSGPNGVSRVA